MSFKLLYLFAFIYCYRIANSGIHCINEARGSGTLNEFLDDFYFIVCVLGLVVSVPHFNGKSLSCQLIMLSNIRFPLNFM